MASKIGLKATIAQNIKMIREHTGMSREQLAKKAKVTARYLYTLESGDRNVTIDTLERLAVALKCDVCDFICSPERPTRTTKDALGLIIETMQAMRDSM
jgi:transcriptional regulator with XRE-family HTH domain